MKAPAVARIMHDPSAAAGAFFCVRISHGLQLLQGT